MPSMGGWEWVILAVIALLLFGGSRVAGIGKSAGKSIREFKQEISSQPPAVTSPPTTGNPAPLVEPTPDLDAKP